MFGANDTNPIQPISTEGVRLPYNANVVPQMQLDVGFNTDRVNTAGDKYTSFFNVPENLGRSTPVFSQYNFPTTSYNNACLNNAGLVNTAGDKYTSFFNVPENLGRSTPVFSQYNFPTTSYNNACLNNAGLVRNVPVSTGLKLAYGEDQNTSISSAGGCSSTICHNDDLLSKIIRQRAEYDLFIRIQGENFRKGIAELNQRHTFSLLNAVEKEASHRMQEKDVEIQNQNQRNKELMEKVRQIQMEAQRWRLKAKHDEDLVNVLRNDINDLYKQGAAGLKKGCGESMADDAASSCNQNVVDPSYKSSEELITCKACKSKEVSVLVLPCRHLCLCTDCDVFIDVCPVCRMKKAETIQVYMS